MIALSIKPIYARLIVDGHKLEEYRSWPTKVRGRILIHASHMTPRQYDAAVKTPYVLQDGWIVPPFSQLLQGGIIGIVELTDCEKTDDGYAFVLENPLPLPFVPMKGRLGFFTVNH